MPRQGKLFKKRKTLGWQNITRPRPINSETSLDHLVEGSNDDNPCSTESASKVKLGNLLDYEQFSDTFKYDIVDLSVIERLISGIAVCKTCFGPLSFSVTKRIGLAFTVNLECTNNDCKAVVSERSSRLEKVGASENKVYDINIRYVYALRSIGVGQETGEMFAGVMNLPKPSKFAKYNKLLLPLSKQVCLDTMKEAAEKAVIQNDGDRNIACAFDGSWQRRGFSSLNGVVTATSITTGQVIDVEIMSKYCTCKNRLDKKHSPSCISNYSGTSGGMEVEGVSKMFARSEEKYGIRYKYYLGDGDCKGYDTVSTQQPYGPDFVIEKMECVGHVQKRMGKRLRTYKFKNSKKILSDGKKIGGQGRLTGHAIDTIQIFYGLAIRRNAIQGVEAMKAGIWAEYFHLGSTDDKPEHGLCPKDDKTWCKFQKSKLEGTEYRHSEHTHLPSAVLEEIKPIFRDLANPVLLAKCAHGGTQNISESLNNIIWSRLPKKVFVRLGTLQLGVYEAISGYNRGNIAKCQMFKQMGLPAGENCVSAMKMFDVRRIKKAEKSIQELQKKCRQQTNLKKRKLEDEFEENEDPDNPSYSPGHY